MILYLGTENSLITDFFKNNNINYIQTMEKINKDFIINNKIVLIISYRYRFIIKKEVINLGIRIINLHISYLPWNKGADPNLWSFIDNTIKGITIHYIDEGLDTGDIIYQKKIEFDDNETLKSSYDKLNEEIQLLFIKNFYDINNNTCPRLPQNINEGSIHKLIDKNNIWELIEKNGSWDISIKNLKKLLEK